ncbi:MAG: SAM-dependent DNA methyltransferase, partial [Firmicutes bacterium]|nr:SAM-dependent DNA methyltransferase [Bacillota bacterium]
KIDSSIYKDYVLVMLFVKYLSDTYKERLQEITEKYKGDEVRIKRTLRRQRFIIPDFASISESIRGKKKESAPQTQIRRVEKQSN